MSESHSHRHSHEPIAPHLEEGDLQIGAVFKFVIYLAVFTAIVHVFVYYLMQSVDGQLLSSQQVRYPLALEGGERLPPTPRLQTFPREELTALQADWQQGLSGYRWVDKSAGTVRVPIEVAMKRVLERGLPARSTPVPVSSADAAPTATEGITSRP